MSSPTLILKVIADVQKAVSGLKDVSDAAGGVQAGVGKLALPATAVLGSLALFGATSSQAASDVEQSFGAIESVFKDNADAAKSLSRQAATDVGLATSDYAQLAAVLGAQLKGMGVAEDELVGQTDDLIDIGADLAATFGGSTADAVAAVSSLLRGERDPIEKYGVAIKQVDVDARLAADGLITAEKAANKVKKAQAEYVRAQKAAEAAHKTGTPAQVAAADAALRVAKDNLTATKAVKGLEPEAYKAATAQATLALLTEKTADASGAFARESDTAAHSQQVATAKFEDAQAALGTALLPVIVIVTGLLGDLATIVTENATAFQIFLGIVAGIAAAVVALNVAFKVYQALQLAAKAATIAYTGVQWLLNAALAANPIGIIILLIAGLIAAFVLLWTKSETFRRIVLGVFDAVVAGIKVAIGIITTIFSTLLAILRKPFDLWLSVVKLVISGVQKGFKALADFIAGIIKGIEDAVGGILDLVGKVGDIKLPFTSSASGGGAPAVAGLRSARAGSGRRAPTTINVYTTGDSLQAEQAVVRALRRQTRLNAGVVPALGWQA